MDNYYDYEYDAIKRLSEIFNFDTVEYHSYEKICKYEKYVAKFKNYGLEYLIFIFRKNWNYILKRNVIIEAFNKEKQIDEIVDYIKKDIEYKWLEEIKK